MKEKPKKNFVFDFDSTIFPGEVLDELIYFCLPENSKKHKKTEITKITNLGMCGEISMKESLKRRLEIAPITQKNIEEYSAKNKERIQKKIRELLKKLQEKHTVFIISGGFKEWIDPLLEGLVPQNNIYGNTKKDPQKTMIFENISPLKTKSQIIEVLQEQGLCLGETLMIGDGATDFSVFENEYASKFIGAFFYASPKNRLKVIEKIKKNNQRFFTGIDPFISYIHTLL